MKKILLVNNENISVVNHRMPFINFLIKNGFEVIVASAVIDKNEDLLKSKINFITLKNLNLHSVNPFKDISFCIELYKLYASTKPDFIFHFTAKPNIYGSIVARYLGIPTMATVNGLGRVFDQKGVVNFFVTNLYRYSFRFPRRVYFQNHDDLNLFLNKNIVKKDKSEVVLGSGIDTNVVLPDKNERAKLREKCIFIFASRLIWSKGLMEYIKAAEIVKQEYPMCEFRVFGYLGAHDKNAVSADFLNDYHKNNIIKFYGESNNLLEEIMKSDVVVLPSYYREGVPKVLIEALALGKPIITTNNVGCKEVVEPGLNGFLVPIKDHISLANSMLKIIKVSDQVFSEFGKKSRELAIEKFDQKQIFNSYLKNLN